MSNPFYIKGGFFLIEKFFGIYLVMKLLFIDYTMDSKTIQISEVKDTAPLSFINNEAQFLLTLNENNVKDLKDIKIQKN
ncbi:TPA: hypothetical protein DIC40_08425 [Patescibacteria group bacterium]|nr:hypothetical protein [Candidatus Gracilibacteria bacterium]